MKLNKLVESILMEKSPSAEQAEKLGLRYGGKGRWYDQSNKMVARTVNGQLVKVEDGDAQPGSFAAQQGAEPNVGMPGAPDVDMPDSEEPENPDAEPEVPAGDPAIQRLLAASGGDSMRVKKALAKQHRAGNPKAKEMMARLEAHEKAEQEQLQKSIAAVQSRKDAELAARKAKYAEKYPKVDI